MNNYSQQLQQTMKQSFFIQWCIRILLSMTLIFCVAPMTIHAQTDTLVIYGKLFAPNVAVFMDNIKLPDAQVMRKSSRRIELYIPRQQLLDNTTPTAAKASGGIISSTTLIRRFKVRNLPIARGDSKIESLQILTNAPKVWITARGDASTNAVGKLALRISAAMQDTIIPLQLWYQNIPVSGTPVDINIVIDGADKSYFHVLDDNGVDIINKITVTQQSGSIPIQLRYSKLSAATGSQQEAIIDFQIGTTTLDYKSVNLQGSVIQKFMSIAAFYTQKSAGQYYTDTEASSPQSLPFPPADFLQKCLETLNRYLDNLQKAGDVSKFAQTRFVFKNGLPQSLSSFTEQVATPDLHVDVDALAAAGLGGSYTMPVLLLVNSETTPYQGIVSECVTDKMPPYIIVEAKYARFFIDPSTMFVEPLLISQLKTIIDSQP